MTALTSAFKAAEMMRIRRKAMQVRLAMAELDRMVESVLCERILTQSEVDGLLEFVE